MNPRSISKYLIGSSNSPTIPFPSGRTQKYSSDDESEYNYYATVAEKPSVLTIVFQTLESFGDFDTFWVMVLLDKCIKNFIVIVFILASFAVFAEYL